MDPVQAKAAVRRTRDIDGWFAPEAGFLFALLSRAQREHGISGDVAEIGVHHGKSTVLLAALVDRSSERLVVCDLFVQQTANVSDSGRGNREIFLANLSRHFGDTAFLDVHEKSSAELTVDDVGSACRLFHIDGGHSCSEALGDLRLSAACTRPGGVIVIDDAFAPTWPGVTEAILAFLREREGEFVPLVLGFNKLVLTRAGDEAPYRGLLEDATVLGAYIPQPPNVLKRVTLSGADTYVFFVPGPRRRIVSRTGLYRWYFQRADLMPSWAQRIGERARRSLGSQRQ